MMDDGFEEVSFQDGSKTNYHNNLESGIGDASTAYLDNKTLDYIDDVICFQQVNKFSEKGMPDSSYIDFTQTPMKPPRHVKLKRPPRQCAPSNITLSEHCLQADNDYLQNDSIVTLDSADCGAVTQARNYRNKYISIGVQASPLPPYRLRVLPKCPAPPVAAKDDPEEPKSPIDDVDAATAAGTVSSAAGCCLFRGAKSCAKCVGRVLMSQCGLAVAMLAWALLGAAAFHFTEGPSEEAQANRLKVLQNDLIVGLASDLRTVQETQPVFYDTIQKYVAKHEKLLLEAVSSGYGAGGGAGHIWSYSGCILFAISLLTTLGFGAPVPRTPMGRTTAVVFSAIGIPFHLLLVLNIGMLLARKLQRWAADYRYKCDAYSEKKCHSFDLNMANPKWINWFPIVAMLTYYVIGILLFGVARQRNFESVLFPLDFTATGGVGSLPGYIRILYGIYLEGGVILAGTAVSLLQQSATSKLTELGLKLGLLTNS